VGGAGSDTLDGGLNADVLNGAAGDDTLIGGDGTYSDTFVFGNGTSAFALTQIGATQATVTYGGTGSTVLSGAMASIDSLIGSDLVTDYDLADDNIRISQSTFGGFLPTLNGAYTGNFGVSTDGVTVSWFTGTNGTGNLSAASDTFSLIYDQTSGNLWFVANTTGTQLAPGSLASQLTSYIQGVNAHQIATLDSTPSINGSNYSNEIFMIA